METKNKLKEISLKSISTFKRIQHVHVYVESSSTLVPLIVPLAILNLDPAVASPPGFAPRK